jgi:drug/metabolite transporter (DMT)-like permease
MSYTGEFAALGTAFLWSLTALFFSYSGRRVGSGVVNRTRLIFAIFFLVLLHYALVGTFFPLDAGAGRWGWLALSSLLGLVLGDAGLFYAYALIGPRRSMLVMTLVPVFSSLAALALFGERIAPIEMAGMALTIAAVAWTIGERPAENGSGWPTPEPRRYAFGLAMALVGSLGQTANLVVTKLAIVDGYPAISATVIRVAVALGMLWAWALWRGDVREGFGRLQRDRKAFLAIMGGALVGPTLGIWLSLVAVQATRVGIASTIMALPPVILIPLSAIVFRERITPRSLIGTLLAMAGVALLFLD